MIKFSTDDNLGKVVDLKSMKVWCFGVDPITSLYDLQFAGGKNKFGQLCAYKFTSLNPNTTAPKFSIALVLKNHAGRNRVKVKSVNAQWFIFKSIDATRVDVLDKQSCLINYGFDVDKFMESDVFKLMLPKITATIKKGLDAVPTFIDTLENYHDKQEAQGCADAIAAALPLIATADINNRYYELNNNKMLPREAELDEKIDQTFRRKGIYADLNEKDADDEINEASKWDCVIEPNEAGGDDESFDVFEKNGHIWVATFHDKTAAEMFVINYPKMKEDYLKRAANIS